jgi:hypothetical protein
MNISRLLLATVIALDLSACVEPHAPLLTHAQLTADNSLS